MFIGAKPCCSSEKFQNSSANNSSPDTIHWWKSWDLWTHMKYEVLVAQLYPTFCDPWTVAHQDPLSMEFSRQEYWNWLPSCTPRDLPDPGDQTGVSCLSCNGRQIFFFTTEPPGKPKCLFKIVFLLLPWPPDFSLASRTSAPIHPMQNTYRNLPRTLT